MTIVGIGTQVLECARVRKLIEKHEEVHPIIKIALGESDEVVVRVPVAPASPADGATLHDLQLDVDPGFHVLAVRRGGRYIYSPRGHVELHAGDELIASGPDEGHPLLAARLGWRLEEDEDTDLALPLPVEVRAWMVAARLPAGVTLALLPWSIEIR